MTSEALPIGQIITVLIFLASLLAALYFVRRHGTGLRQHFTAARRAQIVSELSLGPQERLRIVQIDHREYVIISGRNGTPAFFALPAHGARTQSPSKTAMNCQNLCTLSCRPRKQTSSTEPENE